MFMSNDDDSREKQTNKVLQNEQSSTNRVSTICPYLQFKVLKSRIILSKIETVLKNVAWICFRGFVFADRRIRHVSLHENKSPRKLISLTLS